MWLKEASLVGFFKKRLQLYFGERGGGWVGICLEWMWGGDGGDWLEMGGEEVEICEGDGLHSSIYFWVKFVNVIFFSG